MVKALVFDIDGTLLDSVDLHAEAWQEAFAHFGHDVPLPKIRSQIGKGGDQLLPALLSKEDIEKLGKDLEEYRGRLFKEKYLSKVKVFPDVRRLFEKAIAMGKKVALASSAKGDELGHYEKIAGIEDLVQVRTSSADAERSKPHPDIFEAALTKLGPEIARNEVVVIGDSPFDAEAGRKAGLTVIGVRCGGFSEDDLWAAGCVAIYSGPSELLKKFEISPLA